MYDVKWIREHPAAFDTGMKARGLESLSGRVLELDQKRRDAQTRAQEVQQSRNSLSKQIGKLKSSGQDASEVLEQVSALKDDQSRLESEMKEAGEVLSLFLQELPNVPAAEVPEGEDEASNLEIRRHGEPRDRNFEAKQHFEIGEALGLMDFERASKLAGARFVVLSGLLARLERALGQFMLDLHTGEFGYTEIQPPLLVRDEVLFGTGQLPKFAEDLYRTVGDHWLIPTAEVPLTNLVAGETLEEKELPLRFTALTPCFRSEAGAAGKDTRGMLRQHQFNKVELVSVTHPDESEAEHERMTAAAEEVLKRLDIAYRVMVLSSGDMGFSARKTYDIEVWLPGQKTYREISSCSNCGDFQALRMNARYKPAGQKGTRPVHTLNGSGVALGRALIAVIENYQEADGSIVVPDALRPYMGGLEAIAANG